MLKEFWEKHKILIEFSGFTAGLCALFLNISLPQDKDAKLALVNIQIFWLLLLTIGLTVIFFYFVKAMIAAEKRIEKQYDVPATWTMSLTVGLILLWIILNFWVYVLSIYPGEFGQFLSMTLPGIIYATLAALLIFVAKRKNRFTWFSQIIVDSFVVAVMITLAGVYIQQSILKYFYHYWFFLVLPASFLFFFALFIGLSIYRKRKLF
ncbi:MAG: hypothetical protein ABSE68_01375 [Minisyncoccia bacterium]